MTAADMRRRLAALEAVTGIGMACLPTDEERAALAAIEAETGRPWPTLSAQEILSTQAFMAHERATLERVAALTPPGRRRA